MAAPYWCSIIFHPGAVVRYSGNEYIVESMDDVKVYLWMKDYALLHPGPTKKPWDFTLEWKDHPAWLALRKQVNIRKSFVLEKLSYDDWEALYVNRPIPEPSFHRLAGDKHVTFGDGGAADLVFPVFVAPKLKVEEATRERLVTLLRALSDARKDYHTESPVADIIDPDLFPCVNKSADFVLNRIAEYKLKMKGNDFSRDDKHAMKHLQAEDTVVDESLKIREKYHWAPTSFSVAANGEAKILSPINGLDKGVHEELYSLIENVFTRMVPMFKALNLLNKRGPTELQVIVKAQEYNLLPGMSYAGRWHTEGQTENIVAAGVYYASVDETQGGALKFRPSSAPQDWYNFEIDASADVSTGTAVVFANSIPHRFRKIRNNSTADQKRTFLNFFIVDPSKPLAYPSSFCTKQYIALCLRRYVSEQLNEHFPGLALQTILKYGQYLWKDEEEAKEFRQKSREAMLKKKSGWGWINWGNCGYTEFVGDFSLVPERRKSEMYGGLRHTESEDEPKK